MKTYSTWKCPGCGRTYESPVLGTLQVGHRCKAAKAFGKWRTFKVERTKWDKVAVKEGRR